MLYTENKRYSVYLNNTRRSLQTDIYNDPNDYVKDGLIFHLDGIDKGTNEGYWTDLIGGIKFPIQTDITFNSDNVYFGTKAAKLTGDKGIGYNSFTESTIECVFVVYWTGQSDYTGIFIPEKKGLCLFQTTWGQFGTACTGSGNEEYAAFVQPSDLRVTGKNVHVSVSKTVGYTNGTLLTTTGSRRYAPGTYPQIGVNYIGKIYSIRMYNRVLTEDERMQNYRVDLKRFNLIV